MTDEAAQSSSDPKKIKEQSTRAKDRDETERDDLIAVLSTAQGRRFVKRLLTFCREHQSSFHTNAIQMSFLEGHRNVGLMMKAAISASAPQHLQELLARDADVPADRQRAKKTPSPTE